MRKLKAIEGRFMGLMSVSNQTGNQINEKVKRAAMSGVLDLGNVLELVIDGFDDGTLS